MQNFNFQNDFVDEFYTSCQQCPKKCKVNRANNQKGFCTQTKDVKIAFVGLHFGEEPLVTVHGGSGTIFLTGCTLKCAFCQNYQISQNQMGRSINENEFSEICLKLQDSGAENINLVTGSHAIPELAKFIQKAQNDGCKIPFCWNSSAYENIEMLELLKPFVKIWLPDLKTLDENLSENLFNAKNYANVAKKAILWMIKNFPLQIQQEKAQKDYIDANNQKVKKGEIKEKITQGVIIRHLFLPGKFMQTAEVLSWLKQNADKKACISLMNQYTPVPFCEDEKKTFERQKKLNSIENRLVTKQEDFDLQDLIEAYDFDYLFYQELSDDTSWLPDFEKNQPFSNKLAKPIWHWKNN